MWLLGCGGGGSGSGTASDAADAGTRKDGARDAAAGTTAETSVGTYPDAAAPADGSLADATVTPDMATSPGDAAPPDAPRPPAFPPEIDGRIVINEIMASNGLTL